MTLTEAYKQNYIPGFDCRMTTFRNTLALTGNYSLSNGMILGLSGCLTFIYTTPTNNRVPFFTVVGITDQSLEGLATAFDTYLTRSECLNDNVNIIEILRDNLANKVPVNAAINRPLLNYLRKGNDIENYKMEATNVGFHYVSITDVSDSTITFFETDYSQPLSLDLETFKKLWFFDNIYQREVRDVNQPCNGKYYTIDIPRIQANLDKSTIKFVISKVVNGFFFENNRINAGVNGIKTFFKDISIWADNADATCMCNSVYLMKILESNLSGGGFGRRLYSSFLAEVADNFSDSLMKEIAADFRTTAKMWTKFVNEMLGNTVIADLMSGKTAQLSALASNYEDLIINAEIKQFEKLYNWCK